MRFFFLFLISWSSLAFSQEVLDVRFLGTQRTSGSPFTLPISVDTKGKIRLFADNSSQTLLFKPNIQAGLTRTKIEYSAPIVLNRFNFYSVLNEIGWIEVKRQRVEVGPGLSAIIFSNFSVGLTPYKGSMQTIIRYKKSQEEKSLPFKMPKKLEDFESWNEGDYGTFQTYGGIVLRAGVSAGLLAIADGAIGIQNQFLVEVKKLPDNLINLKIGEEDLNSRRINIGPHITTASISYFQGKRVSAEFILDLNDSSHADLFRSALKGRLTELQKELAFSQQKLTWEGREREIYYGVPLVIGKTKTDSHYDLNENGMDSELDIRSIENKGYLTPLRNHQQFVYQTEEGMVLVWSSEMNKVDEKAIEKNFLSKGRILGIQGFDRPLPKRRKMGSVVSQIGIHISRGEMEFLSLADLELLKSNFKKKCQEEKLSCRQDKNISKIIPKLIALFKRPWAEMKGDLGKFLMKEPALIYALIKSQELKKDVYFKFLSEKYQSLEGSSPIEI